MLLMWCIYISYKVFGIMVLLANTFFFTLSPEMSSKSLLHQYMFWIQKMLWIPWNGNGLIVKILTPLTNLNQMSACSNFEKQIFGLIEILLGFTLRPGSSGRESWRVAQGCVALGFGVWLQKRSLGWWLWSTDQLVYACNKNRNCRDRHARVSRHLGGEHRMSHGRSFQIW